MNEELDSLKEEIKGLIKEKEFLTNECIHSK